jgi:hypothetical protein
MLRYKNACRVSCEYATGAFSMVCAFCYSISITQIILSTPKYECSKEFLIKPNFVWKWTWDSFEGWILKLLSMLVALCIFCHVITFEIRLTSCFWRLLLDILYTNAVLVVCTSRVSSVFCPLHCVPVYAHFVEFIYVQFKAIKGGN